MTPQERLLQKHDAEIAALSAKTTTLEERLASFESRFANVAKTTTSVAQLCRELRYNIEAVCDHVQLPLPLIMNPGGPFFEPEDIG